MPVTAAPAPGEAAPDSAPSHNTETYDSIAENEFLDATENPLSTFALDVDTASYSNARRFLRAGQIPPAGAIRVEEFINYFDFDYAPPAEAELPFALHVEAAACPWRTEHRLLRIGIKGRDVSTEKRPPCNLVFLVDVSGSMQDENKLPLLKQGLKLLVENLSAKDRVAIAVYAGAAGLVLPPTGCDNKEKILSALDTLTAGGSTNGGEGIRLAYQVAQESFIKGGINRVILASDGDFNVGTTSQSELVDLIESKAKTGVFLTVLGFGMGNYKDSTAEKLADKGNGNYAYIDTLQEAHKVLVRQLGSTLQTIAKDVKIQVEFNPTKVGAYRLIGYENRLLAKEDFNDDTKDGGELGAGHTVTALYEIVPKGQEGAPGVDPLRYQEPGTPTDAASSTEILTLKLRFKQPEGDTSDLIVLHVDDNPQDFDRASEDFRFAAAVASFGMILRNSEHRGAANYALVRELAQSARGQDLYGYRREFLEMIDWAERAR